MKTATLVFLVKRTEDKITDVCLAMKKRGFGVGRWNGAGGKVKEDETVEDALVRECEEEICVRPIKIEKVAELHFEFENNPGWNQTVHTYLSTKWEGEPKESEEMAPKWFSAADIPFKDMWPDDIYWLPRVLQGKRIKKAKFRFGKGDAVLSQSIEEL